MSIYIEESIYIKHETYKQLDFVVTDYDVHITLPHDLGELEISRTRLEELLAKAREESEAEASGS